MKKFILKSCVFAAFCLLVSFVKPLRLMQGGLYKKTTIAGKEVYVSIEKSESKSEARILVLGDSVGRQLIHNNKHHYPVNSLACNAAIGMPGHYILLSNYLSAGNQLDHVFLIITPRSLRNNMSNRYSFNYFLKPFHKKEYELHFTPLLNQQIQRIPYHFLSQWPHVLTSSWSPNPPRSTAKTYRFISPVSTEYLGMMQDLSDRHGFTLHLIATPVNKAYDDQVYAKVSQEEINETSMPDKVDAFYSSVMYVDGKAFRDRIHLKHPEAYEALFLQAINRSIEEGRTISPGELGMFSK